MILNNFSFKNVNYLNLNYDNYFLPCLSYWLTLFLANVLLNSQSFFMVNL